MTRRGQRQEQARTGEDRRGQKRKARTGKSRVLKARTREDGARTREDEESGTRMGGGVRSEDTRG